MGLQFYYLFISIYGWYHWRHGRNGDENNLPVSRLNLKKWIVALLVTSVLFFIISMTSFK